MKIQFQHRTISGLLSVIIILGIILPSGLRLNSLDCDMPMDEMSMPMDHMNSMADEDCPMNSKMDHHSSTTNSVLETNCKVMIDCACNIGVPPLHVEAPSVLTLKVPSIGVTKVLEDFATKTNTAKPRPPIIYSNSYSSPLLFLANESLLI